MVDLIALSGVAASRATLRFRYRVAAHFVTLVVGMLAMASDSPAFGYGCAVAAALSELAAYTFRRSGSDLQGLSEMARRHGMLADAFGGPVEHVDATDISAQFDVELTEDELASRYGDFYASRKGHGFDRLCDHLQESAFWSKHLYGEAAKRSLTFFLLFFVAAMVLALLTPLFRADQPLYLPRALILIFAFLSSVDWLGDYLAFSSAKSQAEAVDRRLAHLPQAFNALHPKTLAPSLSVFSDYVVARASAPLIPSAVYSKHRDRLNRLWSQRASQGSSSTSCP
jgi:hypothetical protein